MLMKDQIWIPECLVTASGTEKHEKSSHVMKQILLLPQSHFPLFP